MAKKQSTLGKATAAVKGAAKSVGKAVGIIDDKKKPAAPAKKSAAKKK